MKTSPWIHRTLSFQPLSLPAGAPLLLTLTTSAPNKRAAWQTFWPTKPLPPNTTTCLYRGGRSLVTRRSQHTHTPRISRTKYRVSPPPPLSYIGWVCFFCPVPSAQDFVRLAPPRCAEEKNTDFLPGCVVHLTKCSTIEMEHPIIIFVQTAVAKAQQSCVQHVPNL